jgi:predicted extracellular nuclease
MKRFSCWIATAIAGLLLAPTVAVAQSQIVVNEFYRAGNLSTTDEWVEVVLLAPLTAAQLDGFYVGDSTGSTASKFSGYRFTNMGSIAATFPAGTIIVIAGTTGPAADSTFNPGSGDWNLVLRTAGANLTANGSNGDLAGTDVVYVDTNGTNGDATLAAVGHAVNYHATPGAFGALAPVTIAAPANNSGALNAQSVAAVNATASWTVGTALASLTPGQPNGGANSTSIDALRSPPVTTLSINDVTVAEGNTGTVTATFTVSLSAQAGAGGVSFDIATADNTATVADSDYVARSLTGQSIAQGASTFTFDVTVNGDTTTEPNETFFVNVTNVTGATVGDAQGTGTITNDDNAVPALSIAAPSATDEGTAGCTGGTTPFTFTVTANVAPASNLAFGWSTLDGTAQDGTPSGEDNDYVAVTAGSAEITAGTTSRTVTVQVNCDAVAEADETFSAVLAAGAGYTIGTGSAVATIRNDDAIRISAVQGPGAATPISGQTVTVEGIVVGSYQTQGSGQLRGFFVQEEDADADPDPNTSEGLFVFCNTCPVAVAEGQRVRVTGAVSEFFEMTQVTASTAQSVLVLDAGNNLALATPANVSLPIPGATAAINAFYEAREGMRVRFTDTLSVSEYFELSRYGQLILYANGRPFQFTEDNAPSVTGYAAHIAELAGRRVILDDTNNRENFPIDPPDDGTQRIYHPIANGGLSIGTQGLDYFRGGDTVANLTGVLHWSFAGGSSPNAWRIRPTTTTPPAFTPVNTRPATAPNPTGLVRAASVNVLNFFTTIDTTSSNSVGVCGATAGGGAGTLDCRGADSAQELARQRDRTTTALCGLNVDLIGLVEIENTPGSNVLTTLRDDLNARCGGANPWAVTGTDGTIGTDAIRVAQIYRTGRLNPVGSPLFDTDAVHNRPPMAQTYELVGGPQAGQRFTAVANHFKSKSCSGASGADADQNDGQGCFNAARTNQANRLLTWVNGTVIPAAANDPDVLLLGDFNSYGREAPITAITSGGYIDLLATFEPDGYSYLFDGQLGHLDYAFASASLALQVMGAAVWNINADEVPVFDYNDDIRDTGEATFEEEPNGASRTPPRVLYEAATPYRASDHDPVVVGVFGLPPTISAIADQTGLQDTPITGITFTIADPDGMANVTCAANVVVTSSNQMLLPNANITVAGAAQACTLTLTPAAGLSGTTTVTVRVTDGSGLTVEETFTAAFLPPLLFRDGFEPQAPGN